MKVLADEVMTTTEIMVDLFGMDERLVYNLPEKMRYQRIHQYLVSAGAKKKGTKKGVNNTYIVFNLDNEIYLIPQDIFDEYDEAWVQKLNPKDSNQQVVVR
ncbi:hypothetical protein Halha_1759 [Halobacteroides halobius DSM 5150]|uniref:Uncharacterized protein n=1 Tax=Halobacteroides halobius (strain ATCC 35273 / DSM 5150 / MD-1) TaxID=748449 RepID=L0KAX9_HALHC|nr:hypothetical protein [Halobacteroides halobius]AGB41695.1 hypothetical protein Halha_1759 [Halobacteroides halobius DSM 5150]